MNKETIDKIVWWVPIRKIRDNIRNKLIDLFYVDLNSELYKKRLIEQENNINNTNKISMNKDYISIGDCKFDVNTKLYNLWEVFFRRDYEFGGLKNVIFIDVGAYIGDSAIYSSYNDNVSMVYAYEPFSDNFNMLVNNVNLNPKKNIKVFKYGWGNENITIEVPLYYHKISMTHSNNKLFWDSKSFCTDENIIGHEDIEIKEAASILNDIISNNKNNPIVLKLDIEGSELDVITNLDKNNLISKIDIILMEWHYHDYHIITNILEKYGFIWFNEYLQENAGIIKAYRKSNVH